MHRVTYYTCQLMNSFEFLLLNTVLDITDFLQFISSTILLLKYILLQNQFNYNNINAHIIVLIILFDIK